MRFRILPVTSKSWGILVLAGFSSIVCLLAVSADVRYVLAPVAATLFTTLLFWLTLRDRRREIPLVDLGTITVLAIACYTVVPSLQFLLSGMEFTSLSASQLYFLAPTPEQFGALTWWYVIYLLSFASGYLVMDFKSGILRGNPMPPERGTVRSLVCLFVVLSVFMCAIDLLYGIRQSVVYGTEKMYTSYKTLLEMPLFFRQFYGIIGHIGVFFIVKLGLLLIIFLNWKKPTYRYALYAWLFTMLLRNVLWMGARTELVLTILACMIMYHRFVRPLRLTQILSAGIILFAGFIIMGMMRGQATFIANLENFRNIKFHEKSVFSIATEFQTLLGGNYDLLQMKQKGLIDEVPLQFKLFDIVMVIPRQILPFEKLDVQQWYINRSENPGYFMFTPVAQSIIGFGWIELILRGLFLGFVFAKMRAWYIRRATSFWATLFYFYMTIISYYMIRATAIYVLLASILFRFIPLYLFVYVMSRIKLRVRSSSGEKAALAETKFFIKHNDQN